MGKVTVVIESQVYDTTELEQKIRGWLEFISEQSYLDYDLEYRNCDVFVVPSDEG